MLANSADCHPAKENLYRNVCIIGAPLSHGQILEGVDKAPDTLRKCGLVQLVQELGWGVNDIGNLHFRHKLSCSEAPRVKSSLLNNPVLRQITSNEYTEDEVHRCRLLGEACGQIADAVSAAAKRGEFVLSIGGDHGIAAGTIAGKSQIQPISFYVFIVC